ncbi:MAG: DUF2203 domain-containing protein [Chloroflexota bacterium]
MTTYLYTPEEASNLIPEIIRLVEKLQKHQSNVRELMEQAQYPIPPVVYNLGSRLGSDLVIEFEAIEKTIEKVQSFGGRVKDIDGGLVDFPGIVEGREVWLCWKMGEGAITHFHDFGKGFSDRKKI